MKDVKRSKTHESLDPHARPAPDHLQQTAAVNSTRSEADWLEQLAEDRVSNAETDGPGSHPVGATSSANSITADPFARKKALGEPVPQVTRHI